MSFSFGFSGDDIDPDVEEQDQSEIHGTEGAHTVPLEAPMVQAKSHELGELVGKKSYYASDCSYLSNALRPALRDSFYLSSTFLSVTC